MIPLSIAIRRGHKIAPLHSFAYVSLHPPRIGGAPGSDPFGAAYLGSLRGDEEVAQFWRFYASCSDESFKDYMLRSLMRNWLQLGLTVRQWPALAAYLESERLLPAVRRFQTEYRQEIHMSLWAAIDALYKRGCSKLEIPGVLERFGL